MERSDFLAQVEQLEREIYDKKKQLAKLRESTPEQLIQNYDFVTLASQKVSLLDLFGTKDELIVVHNMGKSCSYCTMWADGFNGIYHHLIDQASFVVASSDAPDVQANFAAERKWQFPMISVKGSTFTEELGFQKGKICSPGFRHFVRTNKVSFTFMHKHSLDPEMIIV